MEGWEVMEQAASEDVPGMYEKNAFIAGISQMTQEEVSRFCREYMHLSSFYTWAKNLHWAEDTDFIDLHKDELYKFDEIDFDAPISIIRRK
jgi:hypothetical protein